MRAHRRSGATILCTCQPPRQFPARARGTNDYRPSCTARRRPIFIPLCGLRKAIGVSGEGRNPEGRGEGNVARGLVPRWGRGGAWQNPPCRFAVQNHNSGFSHLGVPAPAGMSDCYESMSRTTIRDRPLRQPLIRHSRHSFVNPAPHSSFRRRPESRGAGRGECSAGACPPLGSGWGVAESAVPIRCTKPQIRFFITWCAGASRDERLL